MMDVVPYLIAAATALALSLRFQTIQVGLRGAESAPRLGGVAILVAMGLGLVAEGLLQSSAGVDWACLVFSVKSFGSGDQGICELMRWLFYFVPVFLYGLKDDLWDNVSITSRLWASIGLGFLFSLTGNDTVNSLGLPGFHDIKAFGIAGEVLSIVITATAIAGYIHALNIIDGLHGFASGAAMVMLLGLGLLAMEVGSNDLVRIAFLTLAACGGFFLVNFPAGRIYLGDSGAYLLGFLIAALAIAIPARNLQVSPWASMLICAYPVIEVFYSIFRRLHGGRRSPGKADKLHLHSLLHRRIVRNNPLSSAFLLVPVVSSVSVAVFFFERPEILQFAFVLHLLVYVLVYRRILKPFRIRHRFKD